MYQAVVVGILMDEYIAIWENFLDTALNVVTNAVGLPQRNIAIHLQV